MQTGQSPWKLKRSRPLWGIWGCKAQQGSRGNKHYRSRSCKPVLGERHVMIMDIYHLNISVIKKIRYWSHKMMNKKEMLSTNRDDNGDATGDGAPDGAKKQQDYLVCERLNISPWTMCELFTFTTKSITFLEALWVSRILPKSESYEGGSAGRSSSYFNVQF